MENWREAIAKDFVTVKKTEYWNCWKNIENWITENIKTEFRYNLAVFEKETI